MRHPPFWCTAAHRPACPTHNGSSEGRSGWLEMVLCVVIGCLKRSGRERDVAFFRIPKIVTHRGKQEYEMTKKRLAGFLAAISREGLENRRVLENDRFCS